jgi:choline-sulfatase
MDPTVSFSRRARDGCQQSASIGAIDLNSMHPSTTISASRSETETGKAMFPTARLMLLALVVTAINVSTGFCQVQEADAKPNILLIIADDLAYDGVHETGNDEVQTPNLDRLARAGTMFTHTYNMGGWNGAICVASRAMLNSGRFLWHANRLKMKEEQAAGRTWSQTMKAAGYETYFTGKWHVPIKPQDIFDHVGSIRGGMPNQTPEGYNRPIEGQPDPWKPWDESKGGFWKGGKHWSEVVGDETIGFLENAKQSDHPFFMYIAFNAPHDPRQSPKEFVDMYPTDKISMPVNFQPEYPYKDAIGCSAKLRDEKLAPFPRTEYAVKVNRQEYYAIITHMDRQIGRILEALEKSGMADDTFVFFTADHGLAVGHHGLIGKQNMYEHSVRVPFFVKGPGIPANKRIDTKIYMQDVVPTAMELAGVAIPDFVEFKSLVPLIRGEKNQQYDAIYGGYIAFQRMVVKDNLKLILYPEIQKARLYDLKNDPFEMNDLAESADQAETIRNLFAELLKLQKETGDELDLRSTFKSLTK